MTTAFQSGDIPKGDGKSWLELFCVYEGRDARMIFMQLWNGEVLLQRLRFAAKNNQVTTVAGRSDVPLSLEIRSSGRGIGPLGQLHFLSG